jgi:hypothetical protein
MIKLTTAESRTVYLSPDAIAQVTEAGASSQWHGIRSYVKTFDCKTIECQESADQVVKAVDAARAALEGGKCPI